jgi:anaerobic magnesium-protoporphyrin IX monomethyl ester cyclase
MNLKHMLINTNNQFKVLLIAMPNVHVGINELITVPNLGISSIAGNLQNCSFLTLDLVLVKNDIEKFLFKIIKEYSPDLVGLSCMSFQYVTAIEIAKRIKKWKPQVKIAIGGYHPTLLCTTIGESPDIKYLDFVVKNEGEKSFNSIVQAIQTESDFGYISNISFKRNGSLIHNNCESILSLDEINYPDRTHRILNNFRIMNKKSDVLETSRGCVLPCTFCSIRSMYGKSFRKYSYDRVITDIKNIKKLGTKYIFIVDDNITLDIKRFMNLCDQIVENNLNDIDYIVQASCKGIASSRELAKKMRNAGFKICFLGIENASKKNLDFLSKGKDTLEESKRAVAYLRENKIGVLGGFILGNPDDDEEDFRDNFRFSKELKIDGPLYFVSTPHYGTELRKNMLKENLVTNTEDFSWYNGSYANVRTKFLSSDDIDRLVQKMYAQFADFDSIVHGIIWRRHILFFLRRFVKNGSIQIYRNLKRIFKKHKDPFVEARERDVKRRKRWFLQTDTNRIDRLVKNN